MRVCVCVLCSPPYLSERHLYRKKKRTRKILNNSDMLPTFHTHTYMYTPILHTYVHVHTHTRMRARKPEVEALHDILVFGKHPHIALHTLLTQRGNQPAPTCVHVCACVVIFRRIFRNT